MSSHAKCEEGYTVSKEKSNSWARNTEGNVSVQPDKERKLKAGLR